MEAYKTFWCNSTFICGQNNVGYSWGKGTKCIILDEPTAMLDPAGKRSHKHCFKTQQRKNITIVYITHFMDEVVYADKIIVMDAGNIVVEGALKMYLHK